MAGARGCFNCGGCAWCFCVVTVVVSPCVQTHVPTPPLFPPSFSCRPWCGADGDRDFFFKLLYIDRAQSKLLSKIHVVCIVTECVRVEKTVGHQAANCPKAGTPTW
jgi:hypothetical protein